jgi:hypothetical protein
MVVHGVSPDGILGMSMLGVEGISEPDRVRSAFDGAKYPQPLAEKHGKILSTPL